jgi:hypothetical protein
MEPSLQPLPVQYKPMAFPGEVVQQMFQLIEQKDLVLAQQFNDSEITNAELVDKQEQTIQQLFNENTQLKKLLAASESRYKEANSATQADYKAQTELINSLQKEIQLKQQLYQETIASLNSSEQANRLQNTEILTNIQQASSLLQSEITVCKRELQWWLVAVDTFMELHMRDKLQRVNQITDFLNMAKNILEGAKK